MRDAGMQVLPLIARPGEPLNPIFDLVTCRSASRDVSMKIAIMARRPFKVVAGKRLPAEDVSVRKTAILRRILNFLSASDRKQRDRETARLIARSGGRFTDELERRMSD